MFYLIFTPKHFGHYLALAIWVNHLLMSLASLVSLASLALAGPK
jgi:hypothetical protein